MCLPIKIRTILHKAWQYPGFNIPRSLERVVLEKVRDRLDASILEPCYGPYRNPWFLVKKKDKDYRLVNAAMLYNKVTIVVEICDLVRKAPEWVVGTAVVGRPTTITPTTIISRKL